MHLDPHQTYMQPSQQKTSQRINYYGFKQLFRACTINGCSLLQAIYNYHNFSTYYTGTGYTHH